jgi:hypothetical protein
MLNILLDTWATTMWRACWQGGLAVLVVIGLPPWRLIAAEPQSAVNTTPPSTGTAGRPAPVPPQTQQRQSPSLVETEVKDAKGGVILKATELERTGKTSEVKVAFTKQIGSVGASMCLAKALYDIAKARKYEYFTILKPSVTEGERQILLLGFTNTQDANIKKEFGPQFDDNDETGHKREWLNVSKYAPLFDNWPGIQGAAGKQPTAAGKAASASGRSAGSGQGDER